MKLDFGHIVIVGIVLGLLVILGGFTGAKNNHRRVNDVLIDIAHANGNYFIDQPEVLGLLNAENTDYVLGLSIGELDLKILEQRIEQHAFVKDAQIFRDLKGNLEVKVTQSTPVARIFTGGESDRYIDAEGNILPINGKHTARVMLVELDKKMKWKKSLLEDDEGTELFNLINHIENDEFWRSQIAHLVMDKKGDITMLPQVTKQKIVFGEPNDLDKKFKKLKIFYKEILPVKGWNTYSLVNLKFKDQIVCE